MIVFLTGAGRAHRVPISRVENEDAVLCSSEWIDFLEGVPEFGNVYGPRKQGLYRIILADCIMSFRAKDWDDILSEWKGWDLD